MSTYRKPGALAAAVMWLAACNPKPDSRTVEGAITFAMQCIEDGDSRGLYKVIDERSRHALWSIVKDGLAARKNIRRHYPQEERAAALAALGPEAKDAKSLFALRCGGGCREAFASQLASPKSMETTGNQAVVRTLRNTTVRLHRSSYGHWGLVWNLEALQRERDQANQSRQLVAENARLYQERAVLQNKGATSRP